MPRSWSSRPSRVMPKFSRVTCSGQQGTTHSLIHLCSYPLDTHCCADKHSSLKVVSTWPVRLKLWRHLHPHLDRDFWEVVRRPQLGGDIQPEVAAVLQRCITQPDAVDATLRTGQHKNVCQQTPYSVARWAYVSLHARVQAAGSASLLRACKTHLLEDGFEQQRLKQGVQLLSHILNEGREAKLHSIL